MEFFSERFEDPDLGTGELLRFREAGTEYLFSLDDSVPGEAVFARVTADGRERGVQLQPPGSPGSVVGLPLGHPCGSWLGSVASGESLYTTGKSGTFPG
ncbi:MAG TPA: hypothetical protein VKD90_04795 [Gemmataceae bacterium]|nr:hypothetical protein [Gemmataceae bacterium]